MRKNILTQSSEQVTSANQGWLDLEQLAHVELSSEDESHPIEAALTSTDGMGWRAAKPGEQTIRLVFDAPQNIRKIQLLFHEKDEERAQEFVLRWLPDGDQDYREIVRQQYNFSPPHTIEELEEYTVELVAVRALEIKIKPDISGRNVRASLTQLRLG